MAPKPSSAAAAAKKTVKVQVYQGATARGSWSFDGATTLSELKECVKKGPQNFQGNPDTKEFRLARDGPVLEDDHVLEKSCNLYAKSKEGKSKEGKSKDSGAAISNENHAIDLKGRQVVVTWVDAKAALSAFTTLGVALGFSEESLEEHGRQVQKAQKEKQKQELMKKLQELNSDDDEADPVVEPAKVKKTTKSAAPKPAAKPDEDEGEDDPVVEAKVKKSVKQAAPKPAPKPVASAAAAAAAAADEEEEEEEEDEGVVLLQEAEEDPQEEEEEESEPAVEEEGEDEDEDEEEEEPVVAAYAKAKAKAAARGIFVDSDRFVPTSRDKPSKKK